MRLRFSVIRPEITHPGCKPLPYLPPLHTAVPPMAEDLPDFRMLPAADILYQDLTRKITGNRPTDALFRAVTKLGEKVADGDQRVVGNPTAGA